VGGGVSITSGGGSIDTAAVLAGGQQFLDRLRQFEEARVAAETAREQLGIGRDVVALRDQAARHVESAREEAEKIKADALARATKEQKSLHEFLAQARDEQMRLLNDARSKSAEADRRLAMAEETHQAATKMHAEATETLAKANSARDAVAAAQAALSKL
jgi:hypothetical protein